MLGIIMIGGPGSGKGSNSIRIAERYDISRLSVGDSLRALAEEASTSSDIRKRINNGSLASNEDVNKIVKTFLLKNKENFIIDGYPRSLEQAKNLTKILKEIDKKLSHTIMLKVSKETAIQRLTMRYNCEICGRSFPHEIRCINCGSNQVKQRKDDMSNEAIEFRWNQYQNEIDKLVQYYSVYGPNPITIDADLDLESVWSSIDVIFDEELLSIL